MLTVRLVYSLTRYWRCYSLLMVASILSFVLVFIGQNDPNLEHYFPYFRLGSNYYYYQTSGVQDLKKLMDKNELDYEYLNSNSKFCLRKNNLSPEPKSSPNTESDDLLLMHEMIDFNVDEEKSEAKYDLVFLVISEALNFKNRHVLRQTWSKHLQPNVKFVFFIGNPNYIDKKSLKTNIPNKFNQDEKQKLNHEINSFKDIVQIDMPDSVNYTTAKTLLSIRWSLTFCSNSKFLFILSDSAVLNINLFNSYLKSWMNGKNNSKTIDDRTLGGFCNYTDEKFASALKVFFDDIFKSNKNFLNGSNVGVDEAKKRKLMESYKGEYCSNLGWMVTVNGARRLWLTGLRSPFIMRLSPAYLNGYLAFKANLKNVNLFGFYDFVPMKTNCLKVFQNDPGLLLCAENFTLPNRFSSYIASWNSPGQLQFGLSKF